MAKARIHVTKVKTTTRTTARVAKTRNKSGGNPHKCPVCGKFMGSGKENGQGKRRDKKETKRY